MRQQAAVRVFSVPLALVAAYGGGAVAAGLAFVAGGRQHPGLALAPFAVVVLLICARARPRAFPAVAAVAFLFYDGFVTGRSGDLAWHGSADGWRIAVLLAAGLAGAAVGQAGRRGRPRPVRRLSPPITGAASSPLPVPGRAEVPGAPVGGGPSVISRLARPRPALGGVRPLPPAAGSPGTPGG
jgi:hypothetical protein